MTNPNESAFPFTPTDRSGQIGEQESGLTKREYFAAMAMQGLMSNSLWIESCHANAQDNNRFSSKQTTCETALIYADALIAELNKEQQ